jgi:hypothetical protein
LVRDTGSDTGCATGRDTRSWFTIGLFAIAA